MGGRQRFVKIVTPVEDEGKSFQVKREATTKSAAFRGAMFGGFQSSTEDEVIYSLDCCAMQPCSAPPMIPCFIAINNGQSLSL